MASDNKAKKNCDRNMAKFRDDVETLRINGLCENNEGKLDLAKFRLTWNVARLWRGCGKSCKSVEFVSRILLVNRLPMICPGFAK